MVCDSTIYTKTPDVKVNFEAATSQLLTIEPRFVALLDICGPPNFQFYGDGFSALFKMIVGQQLSTAAAKSIWDKLEENDVVSEANVLLSKEDFLASLGLSRKKIEYAKGLAKAKLNYDEFGELENFEIIDKLISIKGIGLWTAQMYLIFSLRRQDIFASGDLALKEATKIFLGLKTRPSIIELDEISASWKPYRTIASLILWNYYGYLKKKGNQKK